MKDSYFSEDKFVHAVCHIAFVLVFLLKCPNIKLALLSSNIIGIGTELFQWKFKKGKVCFKDLVANNIGASLASLYWVVMT